MLNIMLMRSVEAPIFDATRAWLSADQRNLFHLVVDELHTYRGTPGAEVGYLLRVLLDRLGLKVGDKMRIGEAQVLVGGILDSEPDAVADRMTYGPRIFLSLATLDKTALTNALTPARRGCSRPP